MRSNSSGGIGWRDVGAFCFGCLAALIFCFVCMVATSNAQPVTDEPAEAEKAIVYDKPLVPVPAGNYMPLYMQSDVQWGHVAYAGGTISDSGCGLTCAAMAVKYLTTQDVTPLTIAEAVGDACLTDGVNDPEKFARWIAAAYPAYNITVKDKQWQLDDALAMVDDGWLCFAGFSGTLGHADYDSHVVLLWDSDESGYWLRDPANAENSIRAFTKDELNAAGFRYFVCLRGGIQ